MARVEVDKLSLVSRAGSLFASADTDIFETAVARTCNLVFIVLDVLKPLGDKAVRLLYLAVVKVQ